MRSIGWGWFYSQTWGWFCSQPGVDQLLGEEEWRCGIQTSWISHLVALITLDIPGRYITGHYNNTTHTDTCLFPKVHMTMSFYHLSLQRYYSVQVTIIFYRRELDYIDIYNMDGINQRAGSQKSYVSVLLSCVNLEKLFNISGSQFVHLQCVVVNPLPPPPPPLYTSSLFLRGSPHGNSLWKCKRKQKMWHWNRLDNCVNSHVTICPQEGTCCPPVPQLSSKAIYL